MHFELGALGGLLHSIRLALGAVPVVVHGEEAGADAPAPAPTSHEFLVAYA